MNAHRRSLAIRFIALAPVALICATAGACGVDGDGVPLPIFEGGVEGSTIVGDANVEAAADASDDGTASEASTDASNDGGDASASATGLVISQMQSRGTGSGNDEFIEIYNASSASITFDSTWTITVRNATGNVLTCTTVTPTLLYTGAGQVIASHEHLLLATSSYSESVTADATFSAGIPDAASLVLLQSGLVVDALCFDYDGPTTTTLTMCTMAPYVCEGTPSLNPHDNTTGTNTDASLERKPGGSGGNTVDANDNASDFQSLVTADPHDLASAAVP